MAKEKKGPGGAKKTGGDGAAGGGSGLVIFGAIVVALGATALYLFTPIASWLQLQ